jgi:hypothetical protein
MLFIDLMFWKTAMVRWRSLAHWSGQATQIARHSLRYT